MRRIFGFILLLGHINFSMFMPQVNEVDGIDAIGIQKDDINSLLEYVDQVVFENPDLTPEDEDDDNGQNFHLIGIEYFFEPFPELVQHHLAQINFQKFYEIVSCRISAVALQILTPPPRN
jgi:hypothetical protein